jgi:hypothetical protein
LAKTLVTNIEKIEMTRILKKPYPLNLYSWKKAIILGMFITFFLVIFQPFGLHIFDTNHKIWIILGYGFLTFLVVSFNQIIAPILLPSILNEKKMDSFISNCLVALECIFNYYS